MDFYCLESTLLGIVESLPSSAYNLVLCREPKDGLLSGKQTYRGPWGWLWEWSAVSVIPSLLKFDVAALAGCCSLPSPYLSDCPSQIWVPISEYDCPTWRKTSLWPRCKGSCAFLFKTQQQTKWIESLKVRRELILQPITRLHAITAKETKINLWLTHHSRLHFLEIISGWMLEFDD